jgi:hypothetical protein
MFQEEFLKKVQVAVSRFVYDNSKIANQHDEDVCKKLRKAVLERFEEGLLKDDIKLQSIIDDLVFEAADKMEEKAKNIRIEREKRKRASTSESSSNSSKVLLTDSSSSSSTVMASTPSTSYSEALAEAGLTENDLSVVLSDDIDNDLEVAGAIIKTEK